MIDDMFQRGKAPKGISTGRSETEPCGKSDIDIRALKVRNVNPKHTFHQNQFYIP
jgi:hypothetical protein